MIIFFIIDKAFNISVYLLCILCMFCELQEDKEDDDFITKIDRLDIDSLPIGIKEKNVLLGQYQGGKSTAIAKKIFRSLGLRKVHYALSGNNNNATCPLKPSSKGRDATWAVDRAERTVIVIYKIVHTAISGHRINWHYMAEKNGNIIINTMSIVWE